MKIRITERQHKMLQELEASGNAKNYVANFQILVQADNDEMAKSMMEQMKNQIVEATKNAEVTPSLYLKMGGLQPAKKIV